MRDAGVAQLVMTGAWTALTLGLLHRSRRNRHLGRLAVAAGLLGLASAVSLLSTLQPGVADAMTAAAMLTMLASALAFLWFRQAFTPRGETAWRRWIAAASLLAIGVAAVRPQAPTGDPGPAELLALATFLLWLVAVLATVRTMWLQAHGISRVGRRRVRATALAILGVAVAFTMRIATMAAGSDVALTPTAAVTVLACLAIAIAVTGPRWLRVLLRARDPHTEHLELERLALSLDRADIVEAAGRLARELTAARGFVLTHRSEVLAHHGMSSARAAQLASTGTDVREALNEGLRTTIITRSTGEGILGVEAPAALGLHGDDEIERLGDLARTVGLALTRIELHEDLQRAKARSEQLLAAVSDLGEGVAVSDGQRILEANDALCRLTGYERRELLDLPTFLHLIDPELRRATAEHLAAVLDPDAPGDAIHDFDTVLIHHSGRRIDLRVGARRLAEPGRRRLILAVRDVSDEKRAVRASRRRSLHLTALQELESRLAGMLDIRAIIDVVTPTVGEIVGSRATAILLFGTDEAAFVSATGITPPEEAALRRAVADPDVRATLLAVPHDLVSSALLRLPDDHLLAQRSACVAIRSERGVLGVLITGARSRGAFDEMDLAILRELGGYVGERVGAVLAYTEQVDTVATLRDAHATKDLMLSTVAHDLRSPLATIATMGRTLAQHADALPAATRVEIAERIAVRAERLAALVADLLDLDRLSRGTLVADRAETDLPSLLRAVLAEHEDEAGRIVVELEDVRASIDPAKTERIVENLLGNALKHTPEGTPVWIGCRAHDDGVLITVEDGGDGIAPEDRARIFVPFAQGVEHGEGFGLGLALVQRFAEVQHGRVWVEERAGGGASFRVWLPDGDLSATPTLVIPEDQHAPDLDPH